MTELQEIPIEEAEARVGVQTEDVGGLELYPEPYLDILIFSKDPELIAEREGIHDRIQTEIQHEHKEAEVLGEYMFEAPPAWNEVLDLVMGEEGRMMLEAAAKRRREKAA